jgi:hypothetical protein
MFDKFIAPISNWFVGKKSILAGTALILGATATFANMLQDGLQLNDVAIFAKGVGSGLAVLGLGGKLQRFIDVLKAK